MIEEETYKILKGKYGKDASWAIWALPETKSEDGNIDLSTKKNIDNCCIFDNEKELLNTLNPNFIFVGLNPAQHNQNEEKRLWANFHSSNFKKSQDYKLRAALYNTCFWGSFMIDVLPKIEETNADKAVKQAKKEDVSESIQNIKEIRKILGGKAIIIAMGNKAYDILKKNLNDDSICVRKITHYSSWTNIDKYKNKITAQLKEWSNYGNK